MRARRHKCPKCDYATDTKGSLEKHIKRTHDGLDAAESFRRFVCDDCGWGAESPWALDLHKLTHLQEGKQGFECDQ